MQSIRNEIFLTQLGKRIKQLREERRLTLLDLAVRMDNHAEQLYRIEHGKRNCSICTLQKIAEALEVSLPELVTLPKS